MFYFIVSLFFLSIILFLGFTFYKEFKGSPTGLTNYREKIGEEYNGWTDILEHFWGPHIHHGYYGPQGNEKIPFQEAQERMIEELLNFGKFSQVANGTNTRLLDVGCGIGGASRYLARKLGCKVVGITLSKVQANRAKELAESEGLGHLCTFQVADALNMPFSDQSFDLILSLESAEHMPNKEKFLEECTRVLKSNGRILIATWCHRNSLGSPLNPSEKSFLSRIYFVWALPFFISIQEYAEIAKKLPLKNVEIDDWTPSVQYFWWEAVKRGLSLGGVIWLLRRGIGVFIRTLRDTYGCYLMHKGYELRLVRYGIFTAIKKEEHVGNHI